MWKVTEHKRPKSKQDLEVTVLLKEIATYDIYYSGELIRMFEQEVKNIKRSNNFSADLMYKLTPRNQTSVELWKLTAKGDYKDKLFTLNLM